MMAVDCGTEVDIEGADSLAVFDSSAWAERGFCKQCGTHLFYRLKGQKSYHSPVGLFGDAIDPEFSLQVFIDKKPSGYSFCEKTKEMTEKQIFDLYAPKE